MTEEVKTASEGQAEATAAPETTGSNEGGEQSGDKYVPISVVHKTVAREKRDVQRKAEEQIAQIRADYDRQMAELKSSILTNASTDSSSRASTADLKRLVDQRIQELRHDQAGQEIVARFKAKVGNALVTDAEFAEAYDLLDLENSIPHVALLFGDFDNTVDMIKECGKYPEKAAAIQSYLEKRNQRAAYNLASRLSESIKKNKAAKDEKSTPAPLGETKPSAIVRESNGPSTISERRKQAYLRV